MGIAIPRPAMRAREERIIHLKLQWHSLRTGELEVSGMDHHTASAQAMKEAKTQNFVALDQRRQAAKMLVSMPRGCDNPKSLFNNRPSAAPWTWSVKRTFSDGAPMSWKSSRHDIEVMRDGQRYVLTCQGRDMRGPKGRVRWFKSFGAAQVAADWERGL